MLGVVLVFIGLPTLLSLFSATQGTPTGGWLYLLSQAFGWGAYIFPLTLIILGGWLILRNFEQIPNADFERLFGFVLLFFNILAWLHLATFPRGEEIYAIAAAGQGGGYIGGFLYGLLYGNLGLGGAFIALFAWFLIALSLTLDVSVLDLFRWISPLIVRVQDIWDDWRSQRVQPAPAPPGMLVFPAPQGTNPVSPSPVMPEPGSSPAQPGVERAWILPNIADILDPGIADDSDDETDRMRAQVIEETLASFGAPVNVVEINRGPTITQFGVEPDFIETRNGRMRVRVGKIVSLADDLALALSARTIRVQAPVPGKGYIGIEVPNETGGLVALRDNIESESFRRLKPPLRFALGEDVAGNAVSADLAGMPHLLIAGATGSGKSVCVNSIICCYLLHNTPDDLRMIMVDPKRVELTGYNGIPHLLSPVVVEMERVVGALQWVLREMDNRYHKLAELGTRNINEYNAKVITTGGKKIPRLLVIIDELADLMMLAPEETERAITRLAQLARATGIHLILATQRPSVDVVTGLIKANIPARIAFAVASGVDSRVILDQPGAERLLGRGDMLFQAPDSPSALRLQGVFVSDHEIQRLVTFWQIQSGLVPQSTLATPGGAPVDSLPAGIPLKQIPLWEGVKREEPGDPLFDEAVDISRRQGRASISMLQRRLRIGYTRAARLIETMQDKGLISSEAGPQGFEILDYGAAAPPAGEE
jgi:S-DNA-T family DNA segregation ATPase FtsK/SpoIIIE